MEELLNKLKEKIELMSIYSHAVTTMYWDMETTLPKNGFEGLNKALTYFSTESFKLTTEEELRGILEELMKPENFEKLDSDWKFIVKRMLRDFEENSRIPVEFYSEYVSEQAEAGVAWQEAKAAEDFEIFKPHLGKLIEMKKKLMEYEYPDKEPYDAMIGQYEEGMDSATIDRLFTELREQLVPLVKKIVAKNRTHNEKFSAYCDPDAQKKVQKLLLEYIGFSFDSGATAESEHPFTLNLSSKDVRLTNHFRPNQAIDPMFSAIHEGGHAIFEQNVRSELDGTVAGSCAYLGIHESQSRFFENILGRNRNFWIPVYEKVQELLPAFKDASLDEFYNEVNFVEPSYIRTMADEVTYCLHIIIRYEMEKEIFRNGAKVDDLPRLWNEKMQEYLGVTPEKPSEGILQDMHWSDASFGYFPTYLLGSIYDGMYLDAITADLGDIDTILAEGRIGEIRAWLTEKIHKYGSTRLPMDTIREVCGKEPTVEPLMRYFTEKYTKIYEL